MPIARSILNFKSGAGMDIEISFFNDFQKQFFHNRLRNSCFSGGFGNGKTFAGCQRAVVFLLRFPGYKYAIVRKSYSDLKRTTMQTFFKLIPGGKSSPLIARHAEQDGVTEFVNGSRIDWLHSDKFDESTLRGLEINSVLIDQAEEIEESIYLVLDGRVGRWDKATVPQDLIDANPNWPRHAKTGRYLVPNYMDILVNPEHTLHWIYQRYHPESEQQQPDHFFISAPTDPSCYDPQTYAQMLKRDPEWVAKYVKGEWGCSDAQIHQLVSDSVIKDPPPEFIERMLQRGALYRVLDHGDSAPTCCLWFAAYKGVHICYREYYRGNDVISNHRKAIDALSGREYYVGNYADPQIFKTTAQKFGGFWSVADEYLDTSLGSEPIAWVPADNNEFATRNRINELLRRDPATLHPVTGQPNSPKLYFVQRTEQYAQGCSNAIMQIKSQKRELLGSVNGKNYFSDDREKSIEDHAYDVIRYYVGIHGQSLAEPKKRAAANSFLGLQKSFKRLKRQLELAS
jgi:hypothetical protein